MATAPKAITIFTDGACSGNPGPGGWACIVALMDGTVHELGGDNRETTNNRMELAATIRSLAMLEAGEKRPIVLYTDSKYVIQGITTWIFGWRSRGWKSAEGKDVANRDLWEELLRQVMRLKPSVVDWKYVRGHAGYPGNERCDEIAVSFSKGKPEKLYVGPIDGYFVDLTHLPPEEPLPDLKSSGSSKSASGSKSSGGTRSGASGYGSGAKAAPSGPVTYLSYHNGVLKRHATWPECEKHVKGQSNAKFKKVKSVQEERETLANWGLDSNS
jgi:ribonuclease HI